MPGVKMLRQNFVSASNKSPKDKRLRPPKISLFFRRVFVQITKEGAGFLPDDTLSHVKKTNLLSRCNRCTTISNLKKEKRNEQSDSTPLLLKQPQCKGIISFYCSRSSQLDCFIVLRYEIKKRQRVVYLIVQLTVLLSALDRMCLLY